VIKAEFPCALFLMSLLSAGTAAAGQWQAPKATVIQGTDGYVPSRTPP
jgi:hypothetical protein